MLGCLSCERTLASLKNRALAWGSKRDFARIALTATFRLRVSSMPTYTVLSDAISSIGEIFLNTSIEDNEVSKELAEFFNKILATLNENIQI